MLTHNEAGFDRRCINQKDMRMQHVWVGATGWKAKRDHQPTSLTWSSLRRTSTNRSSASDFFCSILTRATIFARSLSRATILSRRTPKEGCVQSTTFESHFVRKILSHTRRTSFTDVIDIANNALQLLTHRAPFASI